MQDNDTIVVVGAGQMGTGIAYVFLKAGCRVTLVDRDGQALDSASDKLSGIVANAIEKGLMGKGDRTEFFSRLSAHQSLADVDDKPGLLIETVVEDLSVKQSVMREAERALGTDLVYATNTSALSVTEIASVLTVPDRVIGMHFFNPVHKMKLVELVRAIDTSPDTIERAQKWVELANKRHILVNEMPGFTTSRMSALMGNEAMYMLSEGVASAHDIDTAMRMAFNHPMGPLELGDLTGWDTRLSVLEYLHKVYGEKYRPCPLISKMVKAGHYGKKVGRGVYLYDDDGAVVSGHELGGRNA